MVFWNDYVTYSDRRLWQTISVTKLILCLDFSDKTQFLSVYFHGEQTKLWSDNRKEKITFFFSKTGSWEIEREKCFRYLNFKKRESLHVATWIGSKFYLFIMFCLWRGLSGLLACKDGKIVIFTLKVNFRSFTSASIISIVHFPVFLIGNLSHLF